MSYTQPFTYVDGQPIVASEVKANHDAAREYLNGGVAVADLGNRIVDRARISPGLFRPIGSSAGAAWFESGDVYLFRKDRSDASAFWMTASEKLAEQAATGAARWNYVPDSGARLWAPSALFALIVATIEARVSLNERFPLNAALGLVAAVEAGTQIALWHNGNIVGTSFGQAFEPGSSANYGGVFTNAGGADFSRHRLYVVATRIQLAAGQNDICFIANPNHERLAVRARSGFIEANVG